MAAGQPLLSAEGQTADPLVVAGITKRGRASSPVPQKTGDASSQQTIAASSQQPPLDLEPISPKAPREFVKAFKATNEGPSLRVWLLIIFMDALMLIFSNVMFAYSSFKLDLKNQLGWSEPTLSIVWSCANAGMNFTIHSGLIYDSSGLKVLGPLSVVQKLVGLGGMSMLVYQRANRPWLFGALFFLDAQATASFITLGQCEAMRCTPPGRRGTAVSIMKCAFSVGPILWAYAYRTVFAPRIEELLFCSGLVGAALLAVFCLLANSAIVDSPKKKPAGDVVQGPALSKLLLSYDCAVMCGTSSFVTWGSALVWVSNMSNFAVAAGLESQTAVVQSAFFTANMVARISVGPLMDTFPLPVKVWILLGNVTMLFSTLMMFASGGALLPIAAAFAGASFGADASIEPIMCRIIAPERQATIYNCCKVGGLLSSTGIIWFAGIQAERHSAGAANCVGEQCYHSMWVLMLLIAAPSISATAFWASQPGKHEKTQ